MALTTSEVADQLGTDGKTLRKFFRSEACEAVTPVGQGKRYALDEDDVEDLRAAFEAWKKGSAKKASKKEAADSDDEPEVTPAPKAKKAKKGKGKKAKPEPEVIEDEDLGLDDLEPTAEDLDDIEDLDLDD